MTKPNISFRPSVPEDADFVNTLTRTVMRDYVDATWEGEEEREAYYQLNIFDPETTQIIQVNGVDAGRMNIRRSKDSMYVDEIHLHPEFQGKGIGSAIMRGLIEEASRSGRTIELHALKRNPVVGLYKKLGFRVYREDKDRIYMRQF
ncbi:MAG: GNAT family N-acetyltransferase [Spirochaetales bacterium]|nr:GNAT family N-acetyltransferase [Spirochaetales bacterium]MCF7937026.1 GNAT family N-acetyltransferase [Spirochaetales bacterium]